jgi:hypothetical protein
MPLSDELNNVMLTHDCPHCGHSLQRRGEWFKVISGYGCEACLQPVRLTYKDKLELFAKYDGLTEAHRPTGGV